MVEGPSGAVLVDQAVGLGGVGDAEEAADVLMLQRGGDDTLLGFVEERSDELESGRGWVIVPE